MSIKSLKTPLRYPGGKSKAIKTLSQWYPKIISEYPHLPFINISWGEENVLNKTIDNFVSANLKYKFLEKKVDIDTIIDIENRFN